MGSLGCEVFVDEQLVSLVVGLYGFLCSEHFVPDAVPKHFVPDAVPKHFVPDAVPIKPNYDGSFCSFLWSPNSVASSNLDSLEWGRSPFVIADF